MKFIVILNDKAGAPGKGSEGVGPEEIRSAFTEAGVSAEVQTLAPEQLEAALLAAIATRPDAVIVGGGDGTVRSAAARLAGTGVALGVLPFGTLNHFAKDLKMPPVWRDAVGALATGEARDVDVGEVNGHVFINNCSLGSYAEAVRRRDALRSAHGQGKWPAMLRASFETFRRLRRMRLRVTKGNGVAPFSVRTPVVVIANNRYTGHVLSQSMRARLDEGRLWIYTAHVHRHLAALRMALQSLVRRLDAADALASEPVAEVVIESERGPIPVAVDGELIELAGPLRFCIRPRVLRVLAPKISEKEKVAARAGAGVELSAVKGAGVVIG